jgi:hypothetical protein
MKLNNKTSYFFICCFFLAISIVSCEKTFDDKTPGQTDLDNEAIVQVFNATMNASRNYLYIDGNQVTGSLMTTGSLFPSGAHAFKVSGGVKSMLIRDTSSTTTQIPLAFAQNFQQGNRYTVFLYDTITTPKQKTVQTDIVIPADTSCRIRFANFLYSPNAVPSVDVFSFVLNRNIFTNVNLTDVTSFIPYPSLLPVDTLYFRDNANASLLFKLTLVGGYPQKRSSTIVLRGSHRAPNRTVSTFYNY